MGEGRGGIRELNEPQFSATNDDDHTHFSQLFFQVEAFNKEMEEARNRYDDLRQLDVMLRELDTQGTAKQANSYRRFMNQVKSAVEVCNLSNFYDNLLLKKQFETK